MPRRLKVLVCRGPDCGDRRGSAAIHACFVNTLKAGPLPDTEVEIGWHSCFGQCSHGPNVLVREVRPGENALMISMMPTMAPGAVLYHGVTVPDVGRVIDEHLRSGRVLADLRRKPEPAR